MYEPIKWVTETATGMHVAEMYGRHGGVVVHLALHERPKLHP
jgi:hypothetical protein